ncbi:MAG: 8-amino-7-oxononanoate synthase [Actinobacteria bacterium]|nr:8-amino-7-oxononanoate synthase [Actinomycetota bacterium]
MTGDALGWLPDALQAIDDADQRRELRHLASGPEPWIDVHTPDGPRRLLHLCSNNYLGLATHPEVVAAATSALHRYGSGTGASRLVTGGQTLHAELETELARWKGSEAAVVFSSGYLANLGVLTALVGRGDTVVSDELNHASIVDACRLSGAGIRIYRHGDVEQADKLLADATGRRVLVTDGVFSMDGDIAPLPALCAAAERHGAAVVVDDAHGTGVVGPDGRGTVAATGCEGRVHATVGTLSKALGSVGGFVACDERLAEWLRNRSRPFVFDTAPPAASVAAARRAIALAQQEQRRARVLRLAQRLGEGLRRQGWEVGAVEAAIVPVIVGSNRDALAVMDALLERDVLAVAIRPPSVPEGAARVRATVMAIHTGEDIDHALAAFGAVG